jgi:hypothetical protein
LASLHHSVAIFPENDEGLYNMSWLDALAVCGAGLLVGTGWVVVDHVRDLMQEPGSGEHRNRLVLWLAWISITAVSLGALFGVLYRAARWTDSQALATAGLLVVCGVLSAIVTRGWFKRTKRQKSDKS